MVLGEGRRVEDDQVVFVADVLQVVHRVGGDLRVGRIVAEVELHVLRGQRHGAFGRVHRADFPGAAREGVDREPARVAEGVEHGAALGVAFDQLAVFALVEEEARFLPLFPVDAEPLAVFQNDVRRMVRGSPQVAVDGSEGGLEGERLRRFVVDGREACAVDRAQRLGDLHPRVVHARRVALDDGDRAVDVDDEARQRVALAVDQAITGRRGVVREVERAAHVVGDGDPEVPPRLVDLLALEREHAHGDRPHLVVAQGHEFALPGVDLDERPFGEIGLLLGFDVINGARENPRVAAQKRFLLAFAQVNLRYHLRIGFFGVRSSCS